VSEPPISGYHYADAAPAHTHAYLFRVVLEALGELNLPADERRVFDLGCGNGATAAALERSGYRVTGVDPSEEGIRLARQHHPGLDLHAGSAYDDLAARYGRFPAVVSLEVVEHVFFPRKYAACAYDLLEPGGMAVISTPYHGYLKNLALALAGQFDRHFTALWDYGHIKFWSVRTLGQLLREAGFQDVRFRRVGRVPPLAKSMVAIARRPAG
jgi:2-polyprenyl-6-hydroxyphenyl methylase/3-demethylubiquinone-9 3-methyltransferase